MSDSPFTRLAKSSLVYGLGSILQRFSTLLLLPLFTRELSTSDYGVLSLISVVTVALLGLLNLGTANSISLLYFSEAPGKSRDAIIWTATCFLALNCALLLGLSYGLLSAAEVLLPDVAKYMPLIALALLGQSLAVIADPMLSYLRMNNRPVQYISITVSAFLLTTILSAWLVLHEGEGVLGVLIAQSVGQGALLLLSLGIIGAHLNFRINWTIVPPLVSIGFPSVIGSFATLVLSFSDRWIIEWRLGLEELGVYSIGVSFGMLMAIIVGAFDTAWPPFFASYINRREEAVKLFPRIFSYYVFGAGLMCLAFFVFARPAVILFTSTPFHSAYAVVGLVALTQALYGASSILSVGLYYAKRLGALSTIKWVVALINIGLSILFVPVLGIVGAAASLFVSYLLLLLLAYTYAQTEFHVPYEWRRVLWYLFFILFFIAVFEGVAHSVGGMIVPVAAGVIAISLATIGTLLLFLTRAERIAIRTLLTSNKYSSRFF
jgi:O-antigen/teichoic acid export membrane protein